MRGARWFVVMVGFVGWVGCVQGAPARPAAEAAPEARPAPDSAWQAFWLSHGVFPVPPTEIFEPMPVRLPPVKNLTDGAINDDTAARWVSADIRRGNADGWAFRHLRLDLVNAGVLGSPGLSGTADGIFRERALGAVEIVISGSLVPGLVAAGVISIPPAVQRQNPTLGLTDFVIVTSYRSTDAGSDRVMADGHREPLSRRPAGQLSWQLDTGELREDPAIGPVWYQAHGWSCTPEGTSELSKLCALAR